MRLYRVHPWIDGVDKADPYGALFVPPGQSAGHWASPSTYRFADTSGDRPRAESIASGIPAIARKLPIMT